MKNFKSYLCICSAIIIAINEYSPLLAFEDTGQIWLESIAYTENLLFGLDHLTAQKACKGRAKSSTFYSSYCNSGYLFFFFKFWCLRVFQFKFVSSIYLCLLLILIESMLCWL